MIPTSRAAALALALALLSLAAAFRPGLVPYVLLLDLAFALAFLFDFLRTPSPDALRVQRRAVERAGLSQDFPRTVRIDATALPRARGLRVEVHERFSADFEVRARDVRVPGEAREPAAGVDAGAAPRSLCAPAADDPSGGPDTTLLAETGPVELVRVYRSGRRGAHELGDLRLRLRGRLGLVERQARLVGRVVVRVEPPLLGLRRTLELAASERWRDLGVRSIRRRGGMTEFESLRELVRGDDIRQVDWKASARRGKPIVRQFREERGQELLLVFDCGRRMAAASSVDPEASTSGARRFGRPVRGWTKLDHALDAGLQIAAVALQEGDRVGALAFDDKVRVFLPPARGSDRLERLREAVFDLEPSARESDLERALRELSLRHRRRALVLILSDVADPLSVERQRLALASGSRRHRILFASLDDPSVRALAEGRIRERPSVRAAAFELVGERERSLAQLHGAGVRVLDTLPAEAAAPLLAAWLDARRGLR